MKHAVYLNLLMEQISYDGQRSGFGILSNIHSRDIGASIAFVHSSLTFHNSERES
jgi:hypothetical protein